MAGATAALMTRRIADRLNDTRHPAGSSLEPVWSPAFVQRVLGAAAESILEAVANGEEIQFGRLGVFYPKVMEEREVVPNFMDNPEKITIPRRAKVEFEPSPYAETKMKELFTTIEKLENFGRTTPQEPSK